MPMPSMPVAAATNRAVQVSATANDLFHAAEADPIVKADLQTVFDSISHMGAIVPALVLIVGRELARQGMDLDQQLLTLFVGAGLAVLSYLAQWLMIKLKKPTIATKTTVALFIIAFGVSLTACTSGTGTTATTVTTTAPSLTTAETDALLVDQAFIQVANLIGKTPNEPANMVALAKTLTDGSGKPLDLLQVGLQAIIAGTTPPASVPNFPSALSQLDGVLGDLAPLAATYSAEAGTMIIAAEVLLTTAEKIAGTAPAVTVTGMSRVTHAASSGMSPDKARQTLTSFVAARKVR